MFSLHHIHTNYESICILQKISAVFFSSKHLLFLSSHVVHMMHNGLFSRSVSVCNQQYVPASTVLDSSHPWETPNALQNLPGKVPKSAMSGHNVEVNNYWSPLIFQRRNICCILSFLFWRVSCARHEFLAASAIHPKQATLGRAFVLQINFQGQWESKFLLQQLYALVTVKVPFLLARQFCESLFATSRVTGSSIPNNLLISSTSQSLKFLLNCISHPCYSNNQPPWES